MIRSIDKSSVHRITSGQVLVDLQTAVKELVENSLDAGATNIDVKFKEHGVKSFEVSDNGTGISPNDYETVAMKHHTSKLATFEDLTEVETFGFRGEALFSLCALSERVTITTATAGEAPKGTILEFDRTGRLISKSSKVARQKGTTVCVEGIFSPLPVRHKEFKKNAKRELAKCLNLLNAYALVPCSKENRGVRLSVVNILDKGRKSDQLRTEGKPSLRASVTSLWGNRQLESLTELELGLDVVPEKSVLRRQQNQNASSFPTRINVRGLISKFSPNNGRAASDRQFLYVNGRPCSLPKLQKVFNEVYRSYNISQSPFVIADFILPTHSCDINVSPDKRTVLLHSEGAIITALKEALEAFGEAKRAFAVQSTQLSLSQVPSRTSTKNSESSNGLPRDDVIVVPNVPEDTVLSSMDDNSMVSEAMVTSSSALCSDGVDDEKVDDDNNEPTATFHELDDFSMQGSSTPAIATSDPDPSIPIPSLPPIQTQKPDIPIGKGRRPIQMTLDTSNALWNLQPSLTAPDGGPAKKKRRLEVDSNGDAFNQRVSFRSQLSSFTSKISQENRDDETLERVDDDVDEDADDMSSTEEQASRTSEVTREDEDMDMDNGKEDNPLDPILIKVDREEGLAANDGHLVVESGENHNDGTLFDGVVPQLFLPEPEDDTGTSATTSVHDIEAQEIDDDALESSVKAGAQLPGKTNDESSSSLVEDGDAEMDDPAEILRTVQYLESVDMFVDVDTIVSVWSALHTSQQVDSQGRDDFKLSNKAVDAAAGISNTDEESAERELARVIEKDDFAKMDIIGQFNLGFVIVRRRLEKMEGHNRLDDLFIVDQHAADEKYNFETLQQTTKIQSQKLLRPRALELTATDEILAIDNMDVLRSNGFEIIIDENAKRLEGRVKLVAQPVSGPTSFDMKDLEELVHLLQDRPTGTMVRCSKARAMFAMRACRKSVMIGMALNRSQMSSIVRHMGTMDQPWNCPHGRPTMRHLANLREFDVSKTRGEMGRSIDWEVL